MRSLTRFAFLPILALFAFALPAHAQYIVQQGVAITVPLPDVIDASTHIAGLTGQTGTAYLARINASSGAVTKAASTNNVSETDSVNLPGQYTLTLTATETGTIGWIKGYYKSTGSDPVGFSVQVVPWNPNDASLLGLTGVGTLANQTSLNTKIGTPTGASISADIAGVQTTSNSNNTALATLTTRLGAPTLASIAADIQSRLATSGYTAPPSLPSTYPLSANDEQALASLRGSYVTPGGFVFSTAALANGPAGGGGGGDPFALPRTGTTYGAGTWGLFLNSQLQLLYDGSGNVKSSVQAYAVGQDPATWVNGSTVDILTKHQQDVLAESLQFDSLRTFNSTTHVAVLTWYRRVSGSINVADTTKPTMTKTTQYDTTNTQILSQTPNVIVANLN